MDIVIAAWSNRWENSWFTSVRQVVSHSRHVGDSQVKSIIVLAWVMLGGVEGGYPAC